MTFEIERKFLLTSESWRVDAGPGTRLVQGYLTRDPERTVRVRASGGEAFLTIKGKTTGATRVEIELPLAAEQARLLLPLCLPPLIDKTRYEVMHQGKRWEIDVFAGDNAPLVVAELELSSEDEVFERPAWLGREVTDDPRYYNSRLAEDPYARWAAAET
ncbi:MAG: CYTH domain-containing protein [Myxococcales bacterium]|nr:CYTH domain-containing protein [Myxococcales bacterium]